MQLWNPTPLPLQGFYAGRPYRFPPKQRVTIGNVRVAVSKDTTETYLAEDIAAKLISDLGPAGLVAIDPENPIPQDQLERVSRASFTAWVQGLIDDFNNLNAAQASENLKIFQVPKHYRELQAMLKELKAGGEDDAVGGFIKPEELQAIRERGEISRTEALKRILAAVETGDPEAVMAAATAAKAIDAKSGVPGSKIEHDVAVGEFATPTASALGAQHGRKPAARRGKGK